MLTNGAALERETIARVVRRLIPFAFVCYVVAYVDRVNIGFAATNLQKDLGLGDFTYGLGGGLFFLGYSAFEIPSNLIMERVGARRWIARILVVWGLVSMATMFIVGPMSFYVLRILLGISEAGFFPGIVLYLTYWVPASERARTNALFMAAAPVSVLIGAPVSEALLSLDGRLGLHGWQWLFLVEGFPAVVLGVVAWFYLTDRPEDARWLSASQREWLSGVIARERADRAAHQHGSDLRTIMSGKIAVLWVIYFLNTLAGYGMFLWLPKILKDVSGYTGAALSGITVIPFAAALVGMVLIGRHSDRTGERKRHVAVCALAAAAGIVLAVVFKDSVPLIVVSFALAQIGQRSVMCLFWTIPPIFLGSAAAAGIALINAIGNLGGFFGPSAMGWLRASTGNYSAGLFVLAAAFVLEAIIVMLLPLPDRRPAAQPVPAPARV